MKTLHFSPFPLFLFSAKHTGYLLLILTILCGLACTPYEQPTQAGQQAQPTKPDSMSAPDTLPPNRFRQAVMAMKEISYQLQEYEEKPAADNMFNKKIRRLNVLFKKSGKALIDTISTEELQQVRHAFVKSSRPLSPRLYPRAHIESWEFSSQAAAQQALQQLDALKNGHAWTQISKSPISYFQKQNEIMLIVPGGFYMLKEVPQIVQFLQDY